MFLVWHHSHGISSCFFSHLTPGLGLLVETRGIIQTRRLIIVFWYTLHFTQSRLVGCNPWTCSESLGFMVRFSLSHKGGYHLVLGRPCLVLAEWTASILVLRSGGSGSESFLIGGVPCVYSAQQKAVCSLKFCVMLVYICHIHHWSCMYTWPMGFKWMICMAQPTVPKCGIILLFLEYVMEWDTGRARL